MRVLLLNPVTLDGTLSLRVGRCQGKVIVGLWPSIEYGYLTTLLESRGFLVHLLDANHEHLTFRTMMDRAVTFRPDVVFILSITSTILDDLEIARRLRAARPDLTIVFWGTHATVRPSDYLFEPKTIVVRREPDVTSVELCMALRDGHTSFKQVPGVSWWQDEEPQHAPDQPFLADLDTLPMPSHQAMRTGTHLATDTQRPFALIKTSRGCPFSCVFCTTHAFHGNLWRARSPESIVAEVRLVGRTSGVHDFFFQSDVFSIDRDWTAELCERILDSGSPITWFCNSRVDRLDSDLLRLMKRAGCRLVAFGIESGSDAVLTACRKGTDVAHARSTLAACREVGIPSLTYWVFGLPGETGETIRETLDFVDETRSDYAHFYTPTPLPGSTLFEEYRIARALAAGEMQWSEFFQGVSARFVAPTVTPAQTSSAVRRAYLRFYADPSRIARELLMASREPRRLIGSLSTLGNMVRNYVLR